MDFSEGPAILSRFPIRRSETHKLPECGRRMEPRVLLFAELDTPGGRLPVFSTHTPRATPVTREAVAALVLERRSGPPRRPDGRSQRGRVVGGHRGADHGRRGSWTPFRARHPDATGATVWQPVTAPERRAMPPGGLRAPRSRARLPGGCHRQPRRGRCSRPTCRTAPPIWPSDHYGVLADLAVVPPAPTGTMADDPRTPPHASRDARARLGRRPDRPVPARPPRLTGARPDPIVGSREEHEHEAHRHRRGPLPWRH